MSNLINEKNINRDGIKVAILVDGGFFRKRRKHFSANDDPTLCAKELAEYCRRHLNEAYDGELHRHELYRVFYYDCFPVEGFVFNPITQRNLDLSKTDEYLWAKEFFKELSRKRKFALRFGKINESEIKFYLKEKSYKKIMNNSLTIDNLTEKDQFLMITQKGVDMKIGIDIASLAYKRLVDQIVLITGDSDFVPVAKLARREGIDFILNSMNMKPKKELLEHIDGIRSPKYPCIALGEENQNQEDIFDWDDLFEEIEIEDIEIKDE